MLKKQYKMVFIGASVGGFNALKQVLSVLPEDYPLPILVVQHMLPTQKGRITELLSPYCQLKLKFAENADIPLPGNVYFAPPDYHLRLDKSGVIMISNDEKIRHSRPSIDVLFCSVSKLAWSKRSIAVILTGANADGTEGAIAIKQSGGTIIVQDPKSAENSIMPQSVMDAIKVDHIIWLDQIGSFLWDLSKTNQL